jgi:halimadienyl-diphosphate synthase
MIIPTLVAEAENLGVIRQQGDRILGQLSKMRKLKMSKLAGLKINRHMAIALSSEMAGTDSVSLLDADHLQEPNGSVGYSPASTAYFALNVKPGDERAVNYLRNVARDGGAPFVSPFDIFERCWILWNFSLLEGLDSEALNLVRPHLDFLQEQWIPEKGVPFVSNSTLFDSDDTSVTHRTLTHFGRHPDIQALLSYEEECHFRCYHYEITPSIGANIHILGALKQCGYDKKHPAIQKLLNFIRQGHYKSGYWFDKWHASPYYITAHAIIECQGLDDELCECAINWILKNQKADGSWGFYNASSAEETAYCIQALKIWRINGGNRIPKGRIEMATHWLERHCEPPYPWLWIGKTLYYPELLIQSVILTALAL